MTETFTGGCLCGAVRFEVDLAERVYDICHCSMCRRWSAGPYMAVDGTSPPRITRGDGLAWYRSSEWAERGFCKTCGTSLFYRMVAKPDLLAGVAVDALDDASGFRLGRHIYVDAQPDRYAFADTRPRATEADVLRELGIDPDA